MPHGALSLTRRQQAAASEARAPFCTSTSSDYDPFNDDSTPLSTYGTGAGTVMATPAASVTCYHSLPPDAVIMRATERSPPQCMVQHISPHQPPAAPPGEGGEARAARRRKTVLSATTRQLATSPPPPRAKSVGAEGVRPVVPRTRYTTSHEEVSLTSTVAADGTAFSPSAVLLRVGAASPPSAGRTAVSPPATRPGLSLSPTPASISAPAAGVTCSPAPPLRYRQNTRTPSLTPVLRFTSPRAGSAGTSTNATTAAPTTPPTSAFAGKVVAGHGGEVTSGRTPTVPARRSGGSNTSSATRRSRSGPIREPLSPVIGVKPPASVGSHSRSGTAAARGTPETGGQRASGSSSADLSAATGGATVPDTFTLGAPSSPAALTHASHPRSRSSSTPCWAIDAAVSSSASSIELHLEEDTIGTDPRLQDPAAPFFAAPAARGQFVSLITWLLCRGARRDIGLPNLPAAELGGNASPGPSSSFFTIDYVMKLCAAVTEVLVKEPALLHIDVRHDDTLILVGDIHGQFQDLYTSVLCQQYDRHRCNHEGMDRRFLFMGDYVDRGPHSLEVVLLLLALKVEYPSLVYLTRGNHEEEKTSRVYGFLTEATSVLGRDVGAAVWSAVNKVFLDLPLAAIVTTPRFRFFVTHGGLSPVLHSVEEIAVVNRNRYSCGDITADQDDLVTGLLWSDPTTDVPMYRRNPRGCGFLFGPTATYNFCVENGVDFICRAHQVAMDGYVWTHNDRVVTVFSAPNYCGVNGNKGAVMIVNGHTRRPLLKQYDSIEVEDAAPGPRSSFPYAALFT